MQILHLLILKLETSAFERIGLRSIVTISFKKEFPSHIMMTLYPNYSFFINLLYDLMLRIICV